jgi:hypothetical protein
MGYNVNDLDPFRFVPIQSDPELVGQVEYGIIVPDPDLTFLKRKSLAVLLIFFQNGPICLITCIFPKKIFKMLTKSFSGPSMCT